MSIGSAISGAIGGLFGGGSSGGQQTSQSTNNGSIGQGIGNILAGGLSSALGVSGLVGQNANQLQAGAAAANPFGAQAGQYQSILSQLLGTGGTGGGSNLLSQIGSSAGQQTSFLQSLIPGANISTNTSSLSSLGNVSTSGSNSALQSLLNNPTQLMSSLQGGVQTPSSIQAILNQNPYQLTSGQQFQQDQGLQSLNRSLAATGQIGSGNQYAAAEQYGQNFASQATQQNITNLLGAQQSVNQTAQTNQGTQSLMNQMGQNQFGNTAALQQILQGQSQANFSNQLGTQQLQSTQQQNTASNMQNLLTSLMGIGNSSNQSELGLLGPLLTASQASSSSPATAGSILANLGGAQQQSGQNVASGLAGLGTGIGQLISGIPFGSSSGASGSENLGAAATSTPDDLLADFGF